MFFDRFLIKYDEPLFRPPGEAESLILQVTLGCAWNRCSFCEMYTTKTFRIKKEEDVLGEIRLAAAALPDTRKIFLADGNPFVLSPNKLLVILNAIRSSFLKIRRVTTYALPADINAKSVEELKEFAMRDFGRYTLALNQGMMNY